MASNALPKDLDDLITSGLDMVDGLDQLEVAIGIKQNTKAATEPDVLDFRTKKEAFDTLFGQTNAKNAAVTIANSNARGFCTLARDNFKRVFGAKAGAPWTAAGWPDDSIAVPSKPDDVLPLLRGVKNFLTLNPQHEINTAEVVLTAVRAGQLDTALNDARNLRAQHGDALDTAQGLRNTAEEVLRIRLRGLINELEQKLDPLSPHWHTFGLRQPGAPDVPDRVKNFRATATGGGELRLQNDPAPRAERYHYEIKVEGVDPDFRSAGDSVTEPLMIVPGLSVGAVVDARAHASNETGPGPFGSEVEVVVS
jgi:hypothetical protein